MRIARVAIILLMMTVAVAPTMVGCTESPTVPEPIAPSPRASAFPVLPMRGCLSAAAELPPARALLVIEDASVIFRPSRLLPGFETAVRFRMRETGGTSSATIQAILLEEAQRGGGTYLCTDGLRVPPGGVLDEFYTDDFDSMHYCSAYLGIGSAPRPYIVNVTFADDDGVLGCATARAEVR
jgi:hypothetical protein